MKPTGIRVNSVSALSCLGTYRDMMDTLSSGAPQEVMSCRSGVICGLVDERHLAYESEAALLTRAEKIVLSLIDGQRQTIDQCLYKVKPERIAVIVGTTAGGIAEAESSRCPGHVFNPDYDFRYQRLGDLARFTADRLNAKGLVTGVSTACTSGTRAIGLGMRWLMLDWCDVAVVAGVDAMCEMTLQGFSSLEAVSDSYCRPFDYDRDGINLGEGGGMLVLSRTTAESGEKAVCAGYGDSMDAWHISAPHPEGAGIARAMISALEMADCRAEDIGYINMHGTATPQNDIMEARAVLEVLGGQVPVSSTKAMTGHTLGAAGAIEAVICYALLQGDLGSLPRQHGLKVQDPEFEALNIVREESRQLESRWVLSNSCGFGGHNASLVMCS